ncbi:hypothetical protein JQ574_22735 [Bradyrhizobium sp. AUGA SZCCT0158]|uniref:hypothetical protein n=1 Tax=Bradyrhizobium sp. AUGA SZCCT0158 TaxID=2807661 RepID=UPI001BA9EA85|nr:hypothetical protein [Bradyrhizobium sp. AUGA SZCCT0158]MBR1198817.1 hypothetical protein [Bradyrhizobium sp. AUGA SZCCT0158]
MAFVPPRDRVLEHSTSNSQTVFTVTGAVDTSFNAFSAFMSVGDTTIGGVVEPGVAFRSGILTYSATNEITVTTTKENKGTFSSGGTKEVFMGQPALSTLLVDGAQALSAARRAQVRANLGAAIDELQNVSFAVTASAGALTIALKDADGNDPTATTPIALSFRNSSLTASPNTPTTLEIPVGVSVVVPSTSTCGFISATAGRLWITGWNDGGTFRLGVFNASTTTRIFSLNEHGIGSSLQAVAAGNSAGQHYTSGAAVTNKAFRILGYVDWNSSGVATAGTWTTTNLNSIVTFGPGIKKPGDVVQAAFVISNGGASGSTSFVDVPGTSISFTPTNAANIMKVEAAFNAQITNSAGNNMQGTFQMLRNSTPIHALGVGAFNSTGGTGYFGAGAYHAWDKANSISALTYKSQQATNVGGINVVTANYNASVEELMG